MPSPSSIRFAASRYGWEAHKIPQDLQDRWVLRDPLTLEESEPMAGDAVEPWLRQAPSLEERLAELQRERM
jgi:hypothetical protein